MSFDQRLYRFVFEPAADAPIEAVRALFSEAEQGLLLKLTEREEDLRTLAIQKLNRLSPVKDIHLNTFEVDIANKLALLSMSEWNQLGLGVALLPFSGRIARSMDGNFRRGIRTAFSETQIEALDALTVDPALASDRPQFVAPSVIWKNMGLVHAGGVCAILEQLCVWPPEIAHRMLWKFSSAQSRVQAIVTDIQPQHIEVLCKTLLPNHPWLLSSNQTH